MGQQEAAAQQYRNAVALQPDFVDAHVNLGRALLALAALPAAQPIAQPATLPAA